MIIARSAQPHFNNPTPPSHRAPHRRQDACRSELHVSTTAIEPGLGSHRVHVDAVGLFASSRRMAYPTAGPCSVPDRHRCLIRVGIGPITWCMADVGVGSKVDTNAGSGGGRAVGDLTVERKLMDHSVE